MSLTRIAFFVPAFALPLSAAAGGILSLEVKEYYDDPPVVSTIEISTQDGASRMEVETQDGTESGGMIYHGDTGEMIALDHGEKSYYVFDEASMQQMGEQLSDAMKQMEEALASMPPEQRAMAEKMMKQHMPEAVQQPARSPATLHETGREDTISGYDCDYYEVRRDDRKIREMCVTPWGEIPGGRDIADGMLDMAGFFERMAATLSKETGIVGMGDQQEIFAHLKELDGYPVLTREFDEAGEVTSESVLTSATTEDVDPGLFSPPPGYRKMSLGL